MKQRSKYAMSFEFGYQLGALLIATVVIHGFYTLLVRPRAYAELEQQAVARSEQEGYVARRSVYIMVKDYEQELCFVMMVWAFAIMGYKALRTARERSLLQQDLLQTVEGMRVLPEDTRELGRQLELLESAQQFTLVPRALQAALHRFAASPNIQDVANASHTVCEAEGERLESELSMIRYIAWAIPSVGFIGTVRGIGDALGQADRAIEGDISGVTQSLGVAFNSTLIALLISVVLMFLMHQLQLMQERLVLDAETYCDEHLIRHLYVK